MQKVVILNWRQFSRVAINQMDEGLQQLDGIHDIKDEKLIIEKFGDQNESLEKPEDRTTRRRNYATS